MWMLRKAEPRMHPAFKLQTCRREHEIFANQNQFKFQSCKALSAKDNLGSSFTKELLDSPCQDGLVIKGISFMSAYYHSELIMCVKDPQLSTSTVLQQLHSGDFCSNS